MRISESKQSSWEYLKKKLRERERIWSWEHWTWDPLASSGRRHGVGTNAFRPGASLWCKVARGKCRSVTFVDRQWAVRLGFLDEGQNRCWKSTYGLYVNSSAMGTVKMSLKCVGRRSIFCDEHHFLFVVLFEVEPLNHAVWACSILTALLPLRWKYSRKSKALCWKKIGFGRLLGTPFHHYPESLVSVAIHDKLLFEVPRSMLVVLGWINVVGKFLKAKQRVKQCRWG